MKKSIYILLMLIIAFGCKKEESISLDDVISIHTTKDSVLADGTTIIELTAYINNNASDSKRDVLFSTGSGQFKSNNSNEVTVKSSKLNGIFSATAKLIAPSTLGDFYVFAQPAVDGIKGQYVASKAIIVSSSQVACIILSTNSFGVRNNFNGEIKLSGQLQNSFGNGVTDGVKVILEDFYEDSTPVGGIFKNKALTSTNSVISAKYSPGIISPNQFIYIRVSVLKENGDTTNITSTIKIYIKP